MRNSTKTWMRTKSRLRTGLRLGGKIALLALLSSGALPVPAGLADPGFRPASSEQVRFPAPRSDKEDRNAPKNLTGQVVDKEGKGIAQAVVHLKNKKTLDVRTFISDAEGNYRFNGLNPEADYAVHAEYRGGSSATRTVSAFDDRKDAYLVLEIDTAKQ